MSVDWESRALGVVENTEDKSVQQNLMESNSTGNFQEFMDQENRFTKNLDAHVGDDTTESQSIESGFTFKSIQNKPSDCSEMSISKKYNEAWKHFDERCGNFAEDLEKMGEDWKKFDVEWKRFVEDSEKYDENLEKMGNDWKKINEDSEKYDENLEKMGEDWKKFVEDSDKYDENWKKSIEKSGKCDNSIKSNDNSSEDSYFNYHEEKEETTYMKTSFITVNTNFAWILLDDECVNHEGGLPFFSTLVKGMPSRPDSGFLKMIKCFVKVNPNNERQVCEKLFKMNCSANLTITWMTQQWYNIKTYLKEKGLESLPESRQEAVLIIIIMISVVFSYFSDLCPSIFPLNLNDLEKINDSIKTLLGVIRFAPSGLVERIIEFTQHIVTINRLHPMLYQTLQIGPNWETAFQILTEGRSIFRINKV